MKNTEKLLSMVDFILGIDWLGTIEFCKKYGVPLPIYTGEVKSSADQFLQIDGIKHRLFVEHAKFLNKKLTIDMFEGDHKIFIGGNYIDRQPSHEYNTYVIAGDSGNNIVFRDSNSARNQSLGLKVSDIAGLGVNYIPRK